MRALAVMLIAAGLLWSPAAWAFQVLVPYQNIQVRPGPDIRSGKPVARVSNQLLPLLDSTYSADGELWCRIQLPNRQTGWIESRYLDPALDRNAPLRLVELPAPLVFEFARQRLAQESLPRQQQRLTLMMELAFLKEQWEYLRSRENFLELSRRVGIALRNGELEDTIRRRQMTEQRFQRALSTFQRSSP